jgi:hypothetical protein
MTKTCEVCKDSGCCPTCDGRGAMPAPDGRLRMPCGTCFGSGECLACAEECESGNDYQHRNVTG